MSGCCALTAAQRWAPTRQAIGLCQTSPFPPGSQYSQFREGAALGFRNNERNPRPPATALQVRGRVGVKEAEVLRVIVRPPPEADRGGQQQEDGGDEESL